MQLGLRKSSWRFPSCALAIPAQTAARARMRIGHYALPVDLLDIPAHYYYHSQGMSVILH